MQRFIVSITQENFELIEDKYVGCFIVPDKSDFGFIKNFVQKAKAAEKLVLISGESAADIMIKTGADGFVADTATDEHPNRIVKSARTNFPKAVIGAICRNRRHEAMLVSECEPDFVIFRVWKDGAAKTAELLSWYNELFLIQSAIMPMDNDMDTKSFEADFVVVDDVKYRKII